MPAFVKHATLTKLNRFYKIALEGEKKAFQIIKDFKVGGSVAAKKDPGN